MLLSKNIHKVKKTDYVCFDFYGTDVRLKIHIFQKGILAHGKKQGLICIATFILEFRLLV